MIFRKGELFCGPGGLSLGAKEAVVIDENGQVVLDENGEEYKVVHEWANDFHEDTCKTFRRNIVGNDDDTETVRHGDVKELDIKSLPPIDFFAFGFPCNDFSLVGETKGLEGEYGGLYTYGIKVLNHHNPKVFIAENVGGLESANGGKAFVQILKAMEEAGKYGYNITPHKYQFEQYGIPQARHRIIIVGIRKDLGLKFQVPKAPFKDKKQWMTAKQALENPPIPDDAFNHEFTNHKKQVVEMLKHIKPGDNCWVDYLPEEFRLNVKGAKMSNIYRRLDPDAPSYTVTGSGGGGTHIYHYDVNQPRALTNRERARLQTFPDWFSFIGGKESVRRQIGMAVPPKGAKVIVEAILKTFAGVPYEAEAEEDLRWDEEHIEEMLATGENKKKKRSGKAKKKEETPEGQTELEMEETKA